MSGTPAESEAGPDPQRWRILGVTLAVGFMVLLDVTIVNVALPSISDGLDAGAGTVQWVVSGYALALGLTLVMGGRLGDAFGRRRLMLVGLIGFVAASGLAGLAPSIEWLIVARLVQGASAGMLTPQSSGLIQSLFSGRERGVAFGVFGLTVSVSSALGPVLGGVIIALAGEDAGWRWIFLVNVPIGVLLLVPIARLVPGRPDFRGRVRLDLLGALLLGAAVLCLLFPVVSIENGARGPLVLLLFVVPLAVGFVKWEKRIVATGGSPLLDLALLRGVAGYASGVVIGTLYFTGFTGVFLVLSVYLQGARGLSALEAGLLMAPFAIGSAIASPIAGRVVDRVGRVLTVFALGAMMCGLVAVSVTAPLHSAPTWLLLTVPLLVAGAAGGAVVSPNMTLSLSDVPPRMGGVAGGALQTGQRIGSAIGAAVAMTVYQVALKDLGADAAVRWALITCVVLLALAFAAAVWSWRNEAPVSQDAAVA